jgi:glucosamine--fructose-6-phosphate aminotransferase (isomerizing)
LAQKEGAATLAITADPDSKITEIADATIFTGGPVTVIVKTFEYIQSLIALYVLAFYLGHGEQGIRDEDHQYYVGQLRLAADATKHFFDEEQDKIVDLVDQYQTADGLFVLGNGINVGTAEEAALKLIEMAKIYSDGCEMEDFFHGRDREITNRTPTFFLAPQNRAEERMLDFLKFNQMVGVPSILLTLCDKPEYDTLANHVISFPGELGEMLSPLIYITPMYVFGYHLALKRGFQPLDRRYSVGALHVKYEEKN